MDFLTPAIGETAARVVIIALVVLLLGALTLLVIGMTMRTFGGRRSRKREGRNPGQRLAVPDVLPVDARRKLVLIRRDNIEHLLLVGGNTDIVVEPTIQRHVATGRIPAAAARESTTPQPAAVPPQTGVVGTGRPLAARSQRAVQATQRPASDAPQAGARPVSAADAPPGTAPIPAEDATALAAARPAIDKSQHAQPKPALIPTPRTEPTIAASATRPQGPLPGSSAMPANPARAAAPVAATAAQPARPERLAQRPAPTSEAADMASARPAMDGRNQEPRPATSARRPAARPTAAAAPPAGRTTPSASAAPGSPPAGGGPSEPLPRPAPQPRPEARRQPAAKLVEGDTDMTALLGEIFGQNKH
jgi:flagellar protein FliO/FliZ